MFVVSSGIYTAIKVSLKCFKYVSPEPVLHGMNRSWTTVYGFSCSNLIFYKLLNRFQLLESSIKVFSIY